jgi:hypothetical protein
MYTLQNLPPFWDRYLAMDIFVSSLIAFAVIFFIVGFAFCKYLIEKEDGLIVENFALIEKIYELEKKIKENEKSI